MAAAAGPPDGTDDTTTAAAGAPARIEDAFHREELASLRLLVFVRIGVSAAIIVYLTITFPNLGGLYWVLLTALFALLGLFQYLYARARRRPAWHRYVWIFLDIGLVVFVIFGGNPWLGENFPLPQRLRYPNFDFLYVVVAVLAIGTPPRAVAWLGMAVVLTWGGFVLWGILLPEYITEYDVPGIRGLSVLERIKVSGAWNFIDVSARIQEAFLMLLFTGTLAAGAWRARRLAQRQVRAERDRAQLSRYFSPAIVEEIVDHDTSVTEARTQNAAVLFADIVGFTSLSEKMPPAAVMDLLRQFQQRMGEAIFAHRGAIDKYIGDEVMATFGTPRPGPDDAGDSIRCGLAMLRGLEDWNRERAAAGEPEIAIGIGIHWGEVVIGDIGDERRLEFAVIGDTVNVASRLQALTREQDAALLISDETVRAAAQVAGGVPAGLAEAGESPIRGRQAPIRLWTMA